MEKFNNRRRDYYIKKEFQRSFILRFCGLVIIGALISAAIVYYMSMSTVTTTFENSRLTIKSTADYILPAVLLSGAVVIIVIGLATVFMTLFTSHKIAGPLYRMEKDIGEVASGNLQVKFNLRTNDELKALAVSLDVMTHNLRKNIEAAKDSFLGLESVIRKSEKDGNKIITPEAMNKMEQIRSALEKFKI